MIPPIAEPLAISVASPVAVFVILFVAPSLAAENIPEKVASAFIWSAIAPAIAVIEPVEVVNVIVREAVAAAACDDCT